MRRPEPRCCLCGEPVRPDPRETFDLRIGQPLGPMVVLRWHLARGCAARDELHMQIAEASSMPDGGDGDVAIADLYLRILDRIGAERGADGLRAAIDIRRDVDDVRVTLRGPGMEWGRRSPRRV